MEVYSVYLGDVFLKCFKNQFDAQILSSGLRLFLTRHGMDKDLVKVCKEVL